MKERNGFDNEMAETCSSDPTSAAVLTTQESVKSESRHTLSVLQSNDDRSSLVVTIHDRPLGASLASWMQRALENLNALWMSD